MVLVISHFKNYIGNEWVNFSLAVYTFEMNNELLVYVYVCIFLKI